MRKLLIVAVLLMATEAMNAQNCTPPAGGFSQASQPPVGCNPYPGALWNKLLPGAGSGGPLTHLAPNSDTIAQSTVTSAGITAVASTGNDGTLMNPIYYGRATDPIYKLNTCPHASGAPYNPLNTFWHIPNQAQMSGGQSDEFFTVWDQTNNQMMSLYSSHDNLNKLASCSATTTGTACSMTGSMNVSYCSMDSRADTAAYRIGNGAGDTLAEAPAALVIRQNEWISGTIPHAIYMNSVNTSLSPSVFPAGSSTGRQASGNWPPMGSLYFFDYTDAQINAMAIPPWQKALILVMSHYGGYVGDTGATSGVNPSRTEAGEAWTTAGMTAPIFGWLAGPPNNLTSHVDGTSQQVFNINIWANIPLVGGLDVAHHAHIADPCVALGMAGQPGGCGSSPPPPPQVNFSPSPLAFGTVPVGTTVFLTSTLSNPGGSPLTFTSATTGNAAQYFIQSTNCVSPIAAGGSCTYTIAFNPNGTSTYTANLTITDNAAGSPHTLPLIGTGGSTAITFNPTSLSYGVVAPGSSSASQSTVISNPGSSTLHLTSATLAGANPGDWIPGTSNCTFSSTLAPGASCMLGYIFKPTAVGARSATISIVSDAPASPQTVPLTGTGGAPVVSLSPASGACGSRQQGTSGACQAFTLTNTGNIDLTNIVISLGGANPTSYSQSNTCPATLTASSSCTITTFFSPTTSGSLTATLSVASNATSSPNTSTLSGTGTVPATITLSPQSINFGNIRQGSSATSGITITNAGGSPVTISGVATSPTPPFSQSTTVSTCDLNATTANFTAQVAAATPGQAVCLATGNYGTFNGVAKSTPGVTIRPQTGATVTMGIHFAQPSPIIQWLIFDGSGGTLNITGGDWSGPSHDITFRNLNFTDKLNIYAGANNNACNTCAAMSNANNLLDNIQFNMSANPSGTGGFEGRVNILGNSSPAGVTISNSTFSGNCADGVQTDGGGNGFTIGPGNEFTNLQQGACGQHIDSFQMVGTSTVGPVITGNYFHNDSTGIIAFDSTNDAIITNNVITSLTQDYITIGNVASTTLVAHNTVIGDIFCSNNHNGGNCPAQFKNNIASSIGVGAGTPGTFVPTFFDYNLCTSGACGGSGTHNLTGAPTFVGGGSPTTYPGFVLTNTSLGHLAGNDGTDMGIPLGGNGPGPGVGSGCPSTLAANASCIVNITAAPTTTGTVNGSFTVTDSAPGSPHVASLSVTGVISTVSLSPTSLSFGNQPVNNPSASKTIVVTNTGTATLSNLGNIVPNVDEVTTSWPPSGWKPVCILPSCNPGGSGVPTATSQTFNNATPSKDGKSMKVSITGPAFSNALWVYVAGKLDTATNLVSDFWVQPSANSNLLGSLEYDQYMFSTTTNIEFMFGTQCNQATNKWQIWDELNVAWVNVPGSTCSLPPGSFHHIVQTVHRISTDTNSCSGQPCMYYDSIVVDGTPIPGLPLTEPAGPLPTGWTNAVGWQLQLDTGSGGTSGQPVFENVDLVNFTYSGISFSGSNPTDFTQTNTCVADLATNGTCGIATTFTPGGTGARSATMSLSTNDPTSPKTAALTGTGIVTAPAVCLSSSTINFGNQPVNTSSGTQPVTVTNCGTANLIISAVNATGNFSSAGCVTTVLPGNTCVINGTFSPLSAGALTGTYSIVSNSASSPDVISLSGFGTQTGATLTPSSINFGSVTVGQSSTNHILTLSNTGNTTLSVLTPTLTGSNPGDYINGSCPATLAPHAQCTYPATFNPAGAGSRTATLTQPFGNGVTSVTSALSGTGVAAAPAVTLTPTSEDFGNVTTGVQSGIKTVQLTNSGTATLNISSITLTGTNAGDYALTSHCGATLASLAICTIDLTVTPGGTGARTANLHFVDDASDSPQNTTLTVNGVASPAPRVTLSTASLAFSPPNIQTGTTSAAQIVTVTNSGNANLIVTGVTLVGSNPGDYLQSNNCSTVTAGNFCAITVNFKPTAAGSRTASVSITSNAASSPDTVTLGGTGFVGTPTLVLAVSNINFGNQTVGTTSSPAVFTITNTGLAAAANVVISAVGDFSVTDNCGGSITAGSSCSVQVTFTPTVQCGKFDPSGTTCLSNVHTGQVSVVSNTSNSPQTVSLQGTAIPVPPPPGPIIMSMSGKFRMGGKAQIGAK